jgi:hypothetical protein
MQPGQSAKFAGSGRTVTGAMVDEFFLIFGNG